MSAAAVHHERPGKLAAWKLAMRVPTLPAAIAPVLVGCGVAIAEHGFRAGPALAALFGALALQVGANFANDVFDFRKGADAVGRLGPPRASQLGLLGQREMLTGMWLCFALATIAGVYLVYEGGWPIVAVGVASIVAAIVYTGGPWPIGYHALGDVFVFTFFGLAAVVGTAYVQLDRAPALAWTAAIPIGCTVTSILVVNNLRDIPTDRAAGKTTLAVLLGDHLTRAWFVILLVVAYAVALGTMLAGAHWPVIAVLLSLPWAVRPVRAVLGGTSGAPLNPVLKATARFNLVFGLLFALGLAASR